MTINVYYNSETTTVTYTNSTGSPVFNTYDLENDPCPTGCMDSTALNYDEDAVEDDGS